MDGGYSGRKFKKVKSSNKLALQIDRQQDGHTS